MLIVIVFWGSMSPVCSDWSAPWAITSSLGNKDVCYEIASSQKAEKRGSYGRELVHVVCVFGT